MRPAAPFLRSWRHLLWLLPLTLLLLAALWAWHALEPEPRLSPAPSTDSESLAQLRDTLVAQDPRKQAGTGIRTLRLPTDLLSRGLAQAAQRTGAARAQLLIQPRQAILQLNVRWPQLERWTWIETTWAETGGWPELQSARVGGWPVPTAWVRWALIRTLDHTLPDSSWRDTAALLHHVALTPQQLTVTYDWQRDQLKTALANLMPREELERLEACNAALVRVMKGRPLSQTVSLAEVLPPLFEHAQQRTAQGHAAPLENRAVLLTLALYSVGQHWSDLIAPAQGWPRPRLVTLTLHGREDFPQHFLISAAIAIEGGGPLSDTIGLYKEMADSRGGSGFSFNDIAADAAGTLMGLRSQQQAAVLQTQLTRRPLAEATFMPEVADLPEFLDVSTLERRFGGPRGAGTQALVAQIHLRVAALPLHRASEAR